MIAMIDRITAGRKKIQIALDEWNEWDWDYPMIVPRPERDAINQFIDLINLSGLEMNQTARDGLFAARVLHVLIRLAPRVPIAVRTHMINSLGAIRTDSTRAFITASGRTMELYSNHTGTILLETAQHSGTFDVPQNGWKSISYLDSAATLSADRKTLFIHLINLHPSERMRIQITLERARAASPAAVYQIASDDFLSRNDFGITRVAIRSATLGVSGSSFAQEVPPHSITTLVAPVEIP
jgi:alpha-L-arabinofuranosidase